MVSKLGELIARYEAAKTRVEKLIDTGSDSETDLIEADQALQTAFANLLQSSLSSGDQLVQRMRYLLDLIRETQPDNQLVQRLADKIWQDVQDLEINAEISVETARNGTH